MRQLAHRRVRQWVVGVIAGAGFLGACGDSSPVRPPQPATRAERSGYTETSRHADVLAFADSASRAFPELVVRSIGTSHEGRDLIAIIASRPRVSDPAAARALGRPIVYLKAGIHSGEVEGKEAGLALLRDLAADSAPNVLDSVVVVFVPMYNADGGEHVGPQEDTRPEQRGPASTGTRTNAQGFDLNRDYIKVEAPETRAFLASWMAWDPDVYVDLHATNGSYHGYALTYAPALNPNANPYARDSMLPVIRHRMRTRHGFETFDYGNFDNEDESRTLTDTVKSGWYSFDGRPRFGFSYVGLRGRIGVLSEAYSHDPFERRVAVTRAFVEEILSYVAHHAEAIHAASARGAQPLPIGTPVSVRGRLTSDPFFGVVAIEVLETTGDSARTEVGVPRGIRRTGRFVDARLPIYDRFESTLERPVPVAYVVPGADTAAVRMLGVHGIRVEPVKQTTQLRVEAFVVDSTWLADTRFQGHHQRSVRGRWLSPRRVTVAPGDWLVPTDQPATALIVYLLEPESDDGLVTWNVFDASLAAGSAFPVRRVVSP